MHVNRPARSCTLQPFADVGLFEDEAFGRLCREHVLHEQHYVTLADEAVFW